MTASHTGRSELHSSSCGISHHRTVFRVPSRKSSRTLLREHHRGPGPRTRGSYIGMTIFIKYFQEQSCCIHWTMIVTRTKKSEHPPWNMKIPNYTLHPHGSRSAVHHPKGGDRCIDLRWREMARDGAIPFTDLCKIRRMVWSWAATRASQYMPFPIVMT